MATVEKRALNLLNGLGDTADVVARSLTAAGITGIRGRASACPIAVYLTTRLPEVEEACVSSDLEMRIELWLAGGGDVALEMPCAVSLFVTAFDLGRFDSLVADGGDDRAQA